MQILYCIKSNSSWGKRLIMQERREITYVHMRKRRDFILSIPVLTQVYNILNQRSGISEANIALRLGITFCCALLYSSGISQTEACKPNVNQSIASGL